MTNLSSFFFTGASPEIGRFAFIGDAAKTVTQLAKPAALIIASACTPAQYGEQPAQVDVNRLSSQRIMDWLGVTETADREGIMAAINSRSLDKGFPASLAGNALTYKNFDGDNIGVRFDRDGELIFSMPPNLRPRKFIFNEPSPQVLRIDSGENSVTIIGSPNTKAILEKQADAFKQLASSFTQGFRTPVSFYYTFSTVGNLTVGAFQDTEGKVKNLTLPGDSSATIIPQYRTLLPKEGAPGRVLRFHIVFSLNRILNIALNTYTFKSDPESIMRAVKLGLVVSHANEAANGVPLDRSDVAIHFDETVSSLAELAVIYNPAFAAKFPGDLDAGITALATELIRLNPKQSSATAWNEVDSRHLAMV